MPISPEKNVIPTVDIGVLKFTANRELAEKFLDFAASAQGQKVFKKHNLQYQTTKINLNLHIATTLSNNSRRYL